jgi:hypothetical protein
MALTDVTTIHTCKSTQYISYNIFWCSPPSGKSKAIFLHILKTALKSCIIVLSSEYTVAYLLHARMVEPQKRPFLSNAHNNGTTGLCTLLLGNGSVNTLLLRHNDIKTQQYLAIMRLVSLLCGLHCTTIGLGFLSCLCCVYIIRACLQLRRDFVEF